ncbi:MAG: hypothetical protein BJG00_001605 [Limnothrix sp. CACIAM 69d]|nr:MAG: hypothetical protein BJG00_001605 [Limnothrix sp. CACIAM 69d]
MTTFSLSDSVLAPAALPVANESSRCNCRACRSARGGGSTNGSTAPIRPLAAGSGSPVVDTIIASTDSGTPDKWPVGPGGTITYSFISPATVNTYNASQDETNIQEVEESVKNNVRAIFRHYSEIVPLNFVEVADSADSKVRIVYSQGPGPEGNAYAYYPSNSERGGAVHLQPANNNDPSTAFTAGPGSYGYSTLIHEIGHALGLKHPGNYNATANQDPGQPAENAGEEPFLDSARDNIVNTIMSYNGDAQQDKGFADPSTLMALDIAALQFMYGTNRGSRAENTTYRLDSSNLRTVQAIWDGGGNDTVDASALPAGDYLFDLIDNGRLTERSALGARIYKGKNEPDGPDYQDMGYGWVVGIGANLENVVGTAGTDEILGNALPNVLQGGAGNDQISGRIGPDTLDGGAGNDLLRGGFGFDVLIGGPGDDILSGDRGRDQLTGGDGADIFVLRTSTPAPTPEVTDILTDFTPGVDRIGLTDGFSPSAVAYAPFTLNGQAGTMMSIAGSSNAFLAFVPGVGADAIGAALIASPVP